MPEPDDSCACGQEWQCDPGCGTPAPEPADRDLFELAYDLLEYDHNEDHDDVQGNWVFSREGDVITIEYHPYDVSPFPAARMKYRVTRISYWVDPS